MKKFISLLLILCLAFTFSACGGKNEIPAVNDNQTAGTGTTTDENGAGNVNGGNYSDLIIKDVDPNNPVVQEIFYRNIIGANILSDNASVKEVDKKADEMLSKIENYADTVKAKEGCKTYYISNDGDDGKDGLSVETAKKTYAALKGSLKPGDAVLFRRGDLFRGQQVLVTGVSYGAYGSGIKPRFYGSIDGTQGEWKETSTKDVYEYSKVVKYGNIIFDNGKAIGRPVENKQHITKRALNVYYNGAKLQIYSPEGNPKDLYKSTEIAEDYSLFVGAGGFENVKIQNFTLMYPGGHHMGSLGIVHGLEVEGCVMGYCGGKDLYLGSKGVSLGNCIEFWSQAVDVYIHDSYFFQAFDAALTHQGPSGTVSANNKQSWTNDFTNIHYENNLIEYCTYDIEAFTCRSLDLQAKSPEGEFTYNDVYVIGNICRYTGWGWGSLDRPDKHVYTTFKYDAEGDKDANGNYTNLHVKPLTISNNIFDRSRKGIFGISTPDSNKKNMILKDNQVLLTSRANIIGGLTINDDYMSVINRKFTASGNTFTVVG